MGQEKIGMWRLTLILNALLMGIFALGSAASQMQSHNYFVECPETGGELLGNAQLPSITVWALRTIWLCWLVPLLWGILTVVLIASLSRRDEPNIEIIQLHTSFTLLVGMSMLTFFIVAGIIPFITIYVGM